MTVFSVAVIIFAILIALLLTRLGPKVTEASSHDFDMDQASAMSFEVWNSLPEKARPKRLALLVQDTFDGKMMGDAWTMMAGKLGYQIPLRVSMGLGGKNFTSQILRAKAATVDAILLLDTVPEAVGQVRQMKENRCNETTEARPFHIQRIEL